MFVVAFGIYLDPLQSALSIHLWKLAGSGLCYNLLLNFGRERKLSMFYGQLNVWLLSRVIKYLLISISIYMESACLLVGGSIESKYLYLSNW